MARSDHTVAHATTVRPQRQGTLMWPVRVMHTVSRRSSDIGRPVRFAPIASTVGHVSDRGGTIKPKVATRRRILRVTWEFLDASRERAPSMGAIARAAGVRRQTVYDHFDSQAELLVAAVRERHRSLDMHEQFALARSAPTARVALANTIRTWCHYVTYAAPVARFVSTASPVGDRWWDDLARTELATRELVERLDAEGDLDQTWSIDAADDLLRAQLHPRSWLALVVGAGWSADAFADRQVEVVERVLLRFPRPPVSAAPRSRRTDGHARAPLRGSRPPVTG